MIRMAFFSRNTWRPALVGNRSGSSKWYEVWGYNVTGRCIFPQTIHVDDLLVPEVDKPEPFMLGSYVDVASCNMEGILVHWNKMYSWVAVLEYINKDYPIIRRVMSDLVVTKTNPSYRVDLRKQTNGEGKRATDHVG